MNIKRNEFLRAVLYMCTLLLALVCASCGNGGGGGGSEATASKPTPLTYTISGRIESAENALVDSDVNDPSTTDTYVPNDRFSEAQELPNPVILGGYVNLPGAGPSGRSQASGDVSDFFRVNLEADQRIILFIASNPASVDLDLYLYDDLENLIDKSMDSGSQ